MVPTIEELEARIRVDSGICARPNLTRPREKSGSPVRQLQANVQGSDATDKLRSPPLINAIVSDPLCYVYDLLSEIRLDRRRGRRLGTSMSEDRYGL